jgi:hypothetical protein
LVVKKLKSFVNYRHFLDKIHRSNDDAYALQIIHKLFPETTYLPFTPFSLNPYTIIHVLNEILINKRKRVVEFGSGISTIIISQFIKINNLDTQLLSVDNNLKWQDFISEEIKKNKSENSTTLIHAPLKNIVHDKFIFKDNSSWYDFDVISENLGTLRDVDLLIVDGPGAGTSSYIRFPALLSVKPYLSDSYCVFLDDVRRQGEREIALKWSELVEGQLAYEKIYATIKVGEAFSSKPLSH